MLYWLLSMLALGSEVGVIFFRTWRTRCLSSWTSCRFWSSTEATRKRPSRMDAQYASDEWIACLLTVQADDLGSVDHLVGVSVRVDAAERTCRSIQEVNMVPFLSTEHVPNAGERELAPTRKEPSQETSPLLSQPKLWYLISSFSAEYGGKYATLAFLKRFNDGACYRLETFNHPSGKPTPRLVSDIHRDGNQLGLKRLNSTLQYAHMFAVEKQ